MSICLKNYDFWKICGWKSEFLEDIWLEIPWILFWGHFVWVDFRFSGNSGFSIFLVPVLSWMRCLISCAIIFSLRFTRGFGDRYHSQVSNFIDSVKNCTIYFLSTLIGFLLCVIVIILHFAFICKSFVIANFLQNFVRPPVSNSLGVFF